MLRLWLVLLLVAAAALACGPRAPEIARPTPGGGEATPMATVPALAATATPAPTGAPHATGRVGPPTAPAVGRPEAGPTRESRAAETERSAPATVPVPPTVPAAPTPPAAQPSSTIAEVPARSPTASAVVEQPTSPAGNGPGDAAAPCESGPLVPLPAPGDPNAAAFWRAFRAPLPPAPRWNPPGPKRVGLQAGHWRTEEAPPELGRLQQGTSGGGKAEWQVTLDLAQRARALLEQAGVQVDLLPATVPPRYQAHAFLAIHVDGDPTGQTRGFKIARPGFSSIPAVDDQFVAALEAAYSAATGLPRDDAHISRRMLYYYAFNSRRYCHAVAPGVPQAIIETGFLTNAADRDVLLGNPDAVARGIADGVLTFLGQ